MQLFPAARGGPGLGKAQIEARLRDILKTIPGIRYAVGFGGSGEKLVVGLTSGDGPALAAVTRDVIREIRTLPGLGSVTSNAALVRPELVVRPDPARPRPKQPACSGVVLEPRDRVLAVQRQ